MQAQNNILPLTPSTCMCAKNFPRISLGTVYRNLNLLADIGEITKITTPDGGDRFDAVTNPHYHVICTSCGRVIDLEMESLWIPLINDLPEKCFDG